MESFAKIVKIIFVILLFSTLGEFTYYVYIQFVVNKQNKPSLSNQEIESVLSQSSPAFLPLSYDKSTDRFYIDIPAKAYADLRKKTAISYAAWSALESFSKDLGESLVLIERSKGTISEMDFNRIIDGKKNFSFILNGKNGMTKKYALDKKSTSKINVVKMVDGKEILMKIDELKNGDNIIIEGKSDLTKSPYNADEYILERKYIKL